MDLSASGAAFVRLHEGFVPRYYLDPVGIPTIGVGFTWRSNAFRDWWGKNKPGVKFGPGVSMTRDEADAALKHLFQAEYGKAVNNFLGKTVAQHVFDGMASVVYNCGAGALKWKWAQAIKAGNVTGGANLLKTTAVTAKGKKLKGLVRRRQEEADLISKGVYTGVGHVAPVEPVDALADGMLIRGERGPAVVKLIKDLALLGYYDGALDDVFGVGTEAAVLAFQRANGMKADGWAGSLTLAKIAELLPKREPIIIKIHQPEPEIKPSEPIPAKPVTVPGGVGAAVVVTAIGVGAWFADLPCKLIGAFCG